MKHLVSLAAYSLFLTSLCLTQTEDSPDRFKGTWDGSFDIPGTAARLVFRVDIQENGMASATVDVPDHPFLGIPVTEVTLSGDSIRLVIEMTGTVFEGILEEGGNAIRGRYEQGGSSLTIVFQRASNDPSGLMDYTIPRVNAEGRQESVYTYSTPPQLEDGWETTPLEAVGIDSKRILEMTDRILQRQYENIHSLLIVKDGKLVFEEYFYGFERSRRHPVHSITKAITSTMIGIAKEKGLINRLDDPLYTFLPEFDTLLHTGPKARITLYHLLTMTAGLEWDESSYNYWDSHNSVNAMGRSGDCLKYVLGKPVQDTPGTRFVYNSGLFVTLGEVLRTRSSLPAYKFAEQYVFAPLGISNYTWEAYSDGRIRTDGGLHLLPRDMAKIGLMFIHNGLYKDTQVVTKDWMQVSSQRLRECNGPQYWDHWSPHMEFINGSPVLTYRAGGFGGQLIVGVPSLDLVVVSTAGNFFPGQPTWQVSDLMNQYILPSILTGPFLELHPESVDRNVVILDDLDFKPGWITEFACLKGCLDYLNIDVSPGWLYGGTGQAFVINVHENVLPNSIGVWNSEMIHTLAKNVGFETQRVYGSKDQDGFPELQQRAWEMVRQAINTSRPCYGLQLHDIPENYIIAGYDSCGYYYKGLDADLGNGPKPWNELGNTGIGWLYVSSVRPHTPAPDLIVVKNALEFALEISESPAKWIHEGYKAGPAGYDQWIDALKEARADGFGMALTAAAWSECRGYAVEFLQEARARLSPDLAPTFDQAILHYSLVAQNLQDVSESYPFMATRNREMTANIEDATLRQTAVEHLTTARDAEIAGLQVLEQIVQQLQNR